MIMNDGDDYSMADFTLKELQKIELNILKYIKETCELYGLNYYLGYGTLIGAIRHEGFIPWDDDIDIFMPRDDYYKLIQICNKKPHDYYKIISYETNKQFTNGLPKMVDSRTILKQNNIFRERVELGVYVDIFVLDGLGNTYEEALNYWMKHQSLGKKWFKSDLKMFLPQSRNKIKDIIRWSLYTPYRVKGVSNYLEQIKKYGEQKSFYDSKYVSMLCWASDNKPEQQLWKREWFGNGVLVPFEGELFSVPKDYDAFLNTQYKNYMQPPPKEQQKGNHSFIAYWR